MNTGLISSRYANALLEYTVSLGQQEEVYDRVKLLSELFVKIPTLRQAMKNRYISVEDKKKILVTACGGSMPSSLSKMIDLILSNEREEALQYIALRFTAIYREKFNILRGKLVTAVAIDNETEQKLITRIREIVKKNVEIESVINSDIIGGFILTLDDFRWDASIAGELSRLRKKFLVLNS